jgi:hypothetical protein
VAVTHVHIYICELTIECSRSTQGGGVEISTAADAVVLLFHFSSSPILVINVDLAGFFICSFLVGDVAERLIAGKSTHAYPLCFRFQP